jgi:hypothetical protein
LQIKPIQSVLEAAKQDTRNPIEMVEQTDFRVVLEGIRSIARTGVARRSEGSEPEWNKTFDFPRGSVQYSVHYIAAV